MLLECPTPRHLTVIALANEDARWSSAKSKSIGRGRVESTSTLQYTDTPTAMASVIKDVVSKVLPASVAPAASPAAAPSGESWQQCPTRPSQVVLMIALCSRKEGQASAHAVPRNHSRRRKPHELRQPAHRLSIVAPSRASFLTCPISILPQASHSTATHRPKMHKRSATGGCEPYRLCSRQSHPLLSGMIVAPGESLKAIFPEGSDSGAWKKAVAATQLKNGVDDIEAR